MGMGILRLSPSAFWSMTFGEVSLALDANRESEEIRERMEWERTRWLDCGLTEVARIRGAVLVCDHAEEVMDWVARKKFNR